jgi:hypothetical protein
MIPAQDLSDDFLRCTVRYSKRKLRLSTSVRRIFGAMKSARVHQEDAMITKCRDNFISEEKREILLLVHLSYRKTVRERNCGTEEDRTIQQLSRIDFFLSCIS